MDIPSTLNSLFDHSLIGSIAFMLHRDRDSISSADDVAYQECVTQTIKSCIYRMYYVPGHTTANMSEYNKQTILVVVKGMMYHIISETLGRYKRGEAITDRDFYTSIQESLTYRYPLITIRPLT